MGDLECLLETFEALLERRKRHSERAMLVFVPGRADAEEAAAFRQYVERGGLLDQNAGVPVGHASDERANTHASGPRRDEAQRGIGLEHRIPIRALARAEGKEVVHDGELVEPGGFRRFGHVGQMVAEGVRAALPGEVWDMQSDFHASNVAQVAAGVQALDRKSTRLNSSHSQISYAV